MKIFKSRNTANNFFLLKDEPQAIVFDGSSRPLWVLKDGSKHNTTCLHCTEKYCLQFSPSEIQPPLKNFPTLPIKEVCPSGALKWDDKKQCPAVDSPKCIQCGFCVKRCPAKAIYFQNGIQVSIETENINVRQNSETPDDSKLHDKQMANLKSLPFQVRNIAKYSSALRKIYEELKHANSSVRELFVRNLFIILGIPASLRRTGDVYTRMDAIYKIDSNVGPLEIEFGQDTLSASRRILDDIAILHTRYKLDKMLQSPLVVCLTLPNARQGYWQVLRDIKKVEKISISTITVGVLLMFLWNAEKLNINIDDYYIDYDNMSMRAVAESQLKIKIPIAEGYLGLLEPQK